MKSLRNFFSFVFLCALSFFIIRQTDFAVKAYQLTEAEISIDCLLFEETGNNSYEIVIEAENSASPVPESELLQITENHTGKFQIALDEPGVFTYRIYQRPGTDQNIAYDSTVYHLSVYVENAQAGQLTYAVIVTAADSGKKPDKIEFQNRIMNETETAVTTTTVTTAVSSGSIPETAVTSDESVTETDSGKRPPILKHPPVKDRIQEIFSPLTGDSAPVGIVSVISLLAAAGTAFSRRKQKGGKNHDEKNQNQR